MQQHTDTQTHARHQHERTTHTTVTCCTLLLHQAATHRVADNIVDAHKRPDNDISDGAPHSVHINATPCKALPEVGEADLGATALSSTEQTDTYTHSAHDKGSVVWCGVVW